MIQMLKIKNLSFYSLLCKKMNPNFFEFDPLFSGILGKFSRGSWLDSGNWIGRGECDWGSR